MGFFFGGASANVTIDGGIKVVAPLTDDTQEFKIIEWTTNGSAQTAYTTPAGKVAYLLGIKCVSGIADAGELTIVDATSGAWIGKVQKVANVESPLQNFGNYTSACYKRSAGEIIKVNGTNARIWALYICEVTV